MVDRVQLEAASAAGIIGADQVTPLLEFLSKRGAGGAPKEAPLGASSGEEDLRFIRNFHDVFLAIGIVLCAIGLAVATATFVTDAETSQSGAMRLGACGAGSAAIMWLLGELFARRRRLFLPAIAIVVAMSLFAVLAALSFYAGLALSGGLEALSGGEGPASLARLGMLAPLSVAFLAPAAFYLRFRLPFSMGLTGAGASLFVVAAALLVVGEGALPYLPPLCLALGAGLFLAGVAFDARDPERATRFSDNGFWLHFAAAPLILNGAFGLIGRAFSAGKDTGFSGGLAMLGDEHTAAAQAMATLLVVALLGVVSLLINRRALIVSALLTTGIAIGVLMDAFGLGAGALAAATLITLGAFVLILGAGWHAARRRLLAWARPGGLWARVFPAEPRR